MKILFVTFLLLVLSGFYEAVDAQPQCKCGINRDNVVHDYDGSTFRLQLPCEYYFTDVTTRDGCHVSVTLDREGLFGFSNNVDMRGLQFSVGMGKDTIFGTINSDGVQKRNSTKGDNLGGSLPGIITEGKLRLLCYEDEAGFTNVYVPTCNTMLIYHSYGLLEVHTPRPAIQSQHKFVCGHCNAKLHPLASLPGNVGTNLKGHEDTLAAWLYYSSLRVMGGSRQCNQFQSDLSHCSPTKAMGAMRMCGSLLTGPSRMPRCIIDRAVRPQIYSAFFSCVGLYCNSRSHDAEKDACAVVKSLADHFGCPLDVGMKC